MFHFIHAADVHLDSPLRGLAHFDDAPVDQIRTATRRAFENLVDLAIAESVAFVLIAGDLWDGDWPDAGPGLFFVKQAARLRDAGIPIYVVKGNHDAQSTLTRDLSWPTNVTMFHHKQAHTVYIAIPNSSLSVAIHGQSFQEANVSEDLSAGYPPPVDGAFNIGMLHTCLDGDARHYRYAPCSVDSLARKGYDYWALGHIHQRRVVRDGADGARIVFPGNFQGRYIPETGPKGCEVVTVADDGGITSRFEALDVVRWLEERVDLTDALSMEDVDRAVSQALEAAKHDHAGRLLAVRLRLMGETSLMGELGTSEGLRDRLTSVAVGLSDIWLERIVVEVRPRAVASPLLLATEVRELVAQIATNDDIAREWMAEFAKLQGHLTGELTQLDAAKALEDADAFRGLVARAAGQI